MKRIGIVGVGGIAQKHIRELLQVKECAITAICDIDPDTLKRVQAQLGLDDAHCFACYEDLIRCTDVDAVEVCTPNHMHVPIAVAAVEAGKPINVEKPLSLDLSHAQPLMEALSKNPVENMMCFSYRFFPAVRFAKWILEKGMLGQLININVEYLKSSALWEGRRMDWRFVKEYAGTGVIGDLGVHLFDMAQFLCGEITQLCALSRIVVKERQKLDSDDWAPVETDDLMSCIAELDSGAAANFLVTRAAIGHANTIKFDIYGTEGVLSFNLNEPDTIGLCVGEIDRKTGGMHTVTVPDSFKIAQEQMFVDLLEGKPCQYLPTVEDGYRCQKLLDALVQSAAEKRWVSLI